MKKICLDAGHGFNTAGNRTPSGANGVVREWTMNDAVCRYVAEYLKDYDVEIVRVDDATGQTDVTLATRTQRVNSANPDLSISVHHNANTGQWGTWGGVEVFSHPNKPKRDADLAKLFTDEMAKLTGLRNRGAKQANFAMVRDTRNTIPSVLTEGGFMDSTTDYPVITTERGQRAQAQAIANICISYLKLQKKTAPQTVLAPGKFYRIQLGAFSVRQNAENMLAVVKSKGFTDAFIKYE